MISVAVQEGVPMLVHRLYLVVGMSLPDGLVSDAIISVPCSHSICSQIGVIKQRT